MERLLRGWGAGFAHACRTNPTKPNDEIRLPNLTIGKGGLHADEAQSFLRCYEEGLVIVDPDGRFRLPGARSCSTNLHLIGRNGPAVAAHMEYLIHLGAYAELILNYAWPRDRISFECGELDIWGHAGNGDISLGAEAKARITGPDSLSSLLDSLKLRSADPGVALRERNHELKSLELLRLTEKRPILLWLVADAARWLFRVDRMGDGLRLREISSNDLRFDHHE